MYPMYSFLIQIACSLRSLFNRFFLIIYMKPSFKSSSVNFCYFKTESKNFAVPTYLFHLSKELTLCHKLWFSNPNIFRTQCRKPLIFQTYIFWSNKSHSLKCQRFTMLESKDIGIRKSEFVANSQFLSF